MLKFIKNATYGPFVEFAVGKPNPNAKITNKDWDKFTAWNKSSLFLDDENVCFMEPILWKYAKSYVDEFCFCAINKEELQEIIKTFELIKDNLKEKTYFQCLKELEQNNLVEFKYGYETQAERVEEITINKQEVLKAIDDFIEWANNALTIADYIVFEGV